MILQGLQILQGRYTTLVSCQLRLGSVSKVGTDICPPERSSGNTPAIHGNGWRFSFLQTRIAIPRYFSQSYGAYFKYIIHVHVHVHTRTVNVCAMLMISYVILKYAPYDWLKCNPRLQKKKSRTDAYRLRGNNGAFPRTASMFPMSDLLEPAKHMGRLY